VFVKLDQFSRDPQPHKWFVAPEARESPHTGPKRCTTAAYRTPDLRPDQRTIYTPSGKASPLTLRTREQIARIRKAATEITIELGIRTNPQLRPRSPSSQTTTAEGSDPELAKLVRPTRMNIPKQSCEAEKEGKADRSEAEKARGQQVEGEGSPAMKSDWHENWFQQLDREEREPWNRVEEECCKPPSCGAQSMAKAPKFCHKCQKHGHNDLMCSHQGNSPTPGPSTDRHQRAFARIQACTPRRGLDQLKVLQATPQM